MNACYIVHMRTDKELAFALRRSGQSYVEICQQLKVAKSTLSNWFHGVDFSEAIKLSLQAKSKHDSTKRLIVLNKQRGDSLAALYAQAEQEALSDFETYCKDPLFIAGLACYWGEGDKMLKNHIRITNTDPRMIQLFVQFILRFSNVPKDKLRIALFLYDDLDESVCKKYWTGWSGLSNFHKTMILPSRHKTRRLPYGTCSIIVMNNYFKRKMYIWIDQLPKMVLNMVPS